MTTDRSSVEENVKQFYTGQHGWELLEDGTTRDLQLFEDLRDCARDYVAACRGRLARHVPETGRFLLDAGSGPIQHPEYAQLSRGYDKRYCADLSIDALAIAAKRIGDHGEFIHKSILDLDLPDGFFDAVVSAHVIYHIDRNEQEKAVRNLVRMVAAEHKVVIVYDNPRSLFGDAGPLSLVKRLFKRAVNWQATPADLYYFVHPLSWWRRFGDVASVEILPFRTMATREAKLLIPDNALGKRMLRTLFWLEDHLPRVYTRLGKYITVVLTKRV